MGCTYGFLPLNTPLLRAPTVLIQIKPQSSLKCWLNFNLKIDIGGWWILWWGLWRATRDRPSSASARNPGRPDGEPAGCWSTIQRYTEADKTHQRLGEIHFRKSEKSSSENIRCSRYLFKGKANLKQQEATHRVLLPPSLNLIQETFKHCQRHNGPRVLTL